MPADQLAVKEIFLAAAELPPPDRAAYLDTACGDDTELRQRIEELLKSHDEPGDFTGVYVPSRELSGVPAIGALIGPYRLIRQIGEGGMGTVFMAEQSHPVQRQVAVKVIKAGMDSRQVVARFEAERQALALMDHVNIARVIDAGATESGRPYFVMELVHGVPITNYCDEHQLTPHQRLELFVPICQAIQHAHQKGIIHRDIKPSNVLVTQYEGRAVPKVIDFGVAKAIEQRLTNSTLFTQFGAMVGTLEYMAPEQAEMSAESADTRSDIYSLGVLLYELLTGSTPMDRHRLKVAAFGEMLRIIREDEPPKPSARLSDSGEALASISARRHMEPAKLTRLVRGELDWIVMKSLEKDRDRRYETANGLAADVLRYLNDEAVEACPPSAGYRLRKFVRRNKRTVLAAGLVLATLVVGIIGTSWGMMRADQAWRAEADQRAHADRQKHEALEQKRRADDQRTKAVASEAETQAFSTFLLEDLLAAARPKNERGGLGIEVSVKDALDAAAAKITKRFVGQPRAEALARHSVGVTYRTIGDLDRSLEHLQRAYDLRVETLGADHEETLISGNSLALLLHTRGQFPKAESLYVKTLEAQRRALGHEHHITLVTMGNLAGLYRAQGKYREAEALLVPALEALRRTQGEEHSHTLVTTNTLASVYRATGQLAKAEPLCVRTYDLRRQLLGDEHPETLYSRDNLAGLYRAQHKAAMAEALYVSNLEIRRRVLGGEHAETLNSMSNLALLYRELGRHSEAEQLGFQALEVSRRVLGEEHPNTLQFMNNLAGQYRAQDQPAKAEPLLVRALAVRRRVLGEEHPRTIASMSNLAGLYQDQGHFAEGEPLFREALTQTRKRHGKADSATATALAALGENLLLQQKFAAAEPILRESLAIRIAKEPKDWWTFLTKSILGRCLLGQKDYAAAEPLLLEGYEGLRANEANLPAPRKRSLTESLERIVELYEAWSKPEQAATWRKELATRRPAVQESKGPAKK